MTNLRTPESAPNDPVSPETAAALHAAVYHMAMTPTREGRKQDTGTFTFDSSQLGTYNFVKFDFETTRPDSIGSGQVVVDEASPEFVVWAKSEAGIASPIEVKGETFLPYGYISELTSVENNPDTVMSRIVLPTTSGRVLEINEGEYLGDDPHIIRELGDQEVQDLVASMEDVNGRPTVFVTGMLGEDH